MSVSEERNGFLVIGGYVLAGYLILAPLAEYLAAVWPIRLGYAGWRLGAAGLGSRSLMTPLLGLLLAVVLAVHCGHWILARLLAVASAVAGIIALVAIPVLTLDALDIKAGVAAGPRGLVTAFDLATVGALLVLMATVAITFALARGAWVGTGAAAWDARHNGNRTAVSSRIYFRASEPKAEAEEVLASRTGGPPTGAASSAGGGATDRRNGVPALIPPDSETDRQDPRPTLRTPGPSQRSSRGVGDEGGGRHAAGDETPVSSLASPPPRLNGDQRRRVHHLEIQRWEEEGGSTSS